MPNALINLQNLPNTSETRPFPLITLYGQAGVGKTSLAAEFPRPILINIEGGVPEGVAITYTGREPIRDYNKFIAYLETLRYQEHNFKTVIIDSLDTLEKKVIHPYVKRVNDFDSIDQTFGKAYTRSAEVMDKILDHLEDLRIRKKMYIVLTAAAVKETFDDLINNSYHRFNLALQNQIQTKIFHQSDFMFFMKPDVYMVKSKGDKKERPAGSSRRLLCTSIMPTWVAKSRARGVPDELEYEVGKGFEMLKPHLIRFITGKSDLQQVEAPLLVEEGQTVAEAKRVQQQALQTEQQTEQQTPSREQEIADAKAFAQSVHAGTATAGLVPVKRVNPDDDAGNTAMAEVEQEMSETSKDFDDEIPF